MIIKELASDIREFEDDEGNSYIINSSGTYLAKQPTQERPKIYKIEIDSNEYNILGNDNIIFYDNKKIQRIDELVYSIFNEKIISDNDIILHLNDDTLNDNLENIRVVNVSQLIDEQTIQYEIDDSKVLNDILKLKSKSKEIEKRFNELITCLVQNPYKLPKKFTPTNGLGYKGYPGLFHAVIDKSIKDRVFYKVEKNKIIIEKVDIKGVVKLLQVLGHDWNKAND